jgi:putative membrane protein
MTKYHWFLIILFVAVWGWAAWNPVYPEDWLLENYLVFLFVPVILVLGYFFKLSKVSYTFITIFLILHVIGSHYTYGEVPLGYTLQEWFGSTRNMYDRLVHFACGLLLFYPIREVFMRLAQVKGIWSYFFPISLWGFWSAMYEVLEWGAARVVAPEAGLAFLGSQGDIWDAQKDMMLAIIGSCITALIVFAINWRYKKNFWREIKESVRIPDGDRVLGEVEFARMARDERQ